MYKRLRTVIASLVLAMTVFGGALGVGFACAGEVPDPYYWDSRPPLPDTYAPGYLDGFARRDIAVWEDGTPAPPVDGYIDGPASGAP